MLFARLRQLKRQRIDRELDRNMQSFLDSYENPGEALGRVHALSQVIGRLLNGDTCYVRRLLGRSHSRRLASARLRIYTLYLGEMWFIGRRAYLLHRRTMAGGVWDFGSLWSAHCRFVGHMTRLVVAGLCYMVCRRLAFRIATATLRRLGAELWPNADLAHGVD